jgi:hypothetical protein
MPVTPSLQISRKACPSLATLFQSGPCSILRLDDAGIVRIWRGQNAQSSLQLHFVPKEPESNFCGKSIITWLKQKESKSGQKKARVLGQ